MYNVGDKFKGLNIGNIGYTLHILEVCYKDNYKVRWVKDDTQIPLQIWSISTRLLNSLIYKGDISSLTPIKKLEEYM